MENEPALVLELEMADGLPIAVGAKRKMYWQLAPGATPPAQVCKALMGGQTPPPAKLVKVVSPALRAVPN